MRRMLATIAAMLRRVSVSDDDLALAAAGCRALAFRYREDAKKQKNPVLVEDTLARAEHAELLANDGHDTRAIQQYLGHRNITHTTRYTELASDRFNGFWKD